MAHVHNRALFRVDCRVLAPECSSRLESYMKMGTSENKTIQNAIFIPYFRKMLYFQKTSSANFYFFHFKQSFDIFQTLKFQTCFLLYSVYFPNNFKSKHDYVC